MKNHKLSVQKTYNGVKITRVLSDSVFSVTVQFVYLRFLADRWNAVFSYCHSYLPIKFDDDIQGGPLIWGRVVFNFVAPYLEDGAR